MPSTLADKPALLTSRQVASLLGVCVQTVRRAASDGRLPVVRIREGSPYKFRRADVEALCAADRNPRAVDLSAPGDRPGETPGEDAGSGGARAVATSGRAPIGDRSSEREDA